MKRYSIPDCASSLPENCIKHGRRQWRAVTALLKKQTNKQTKHICFISLILYDGIYRNRVSYLGGTGCSHQGKLDLQADMRVRKPISKLYLKSKHGPDSEYLFSWGKLGEEADGVDGEALSCHSQVPPL